MIPRTRTQNLQVHINSEEKTMIDQLADREQESISTYIRRLIRREWAKLFGEKEGREGE